VNSGRVLAAVAMLSVSVFSFASCEKKMEVAECDNLRSEGFKILNKAQPCGADGDCVEAVFPECRKPVNQKNFDLLAEMKKKTEDGKCEVKKAECKDSPPVYCKQGLCVNREPGRVEE
jgi:hypothetical protein